MPILAVPDVRFRESFLAAMAEFVVDGRAGDHSMIGMDIAEFGSTWSSAGGFAAFVAATLRDAERPRYEHWVRCTSLWWVEDDEYLARIAVRHELNDSLREVGGHIGYDVRPSARRRGHATAMLAATLPAAHDLGIDPALVTCDTDNVASRRTIEANGAIFEDERRGKLRYWIPTG